MGKKAALHNLGCKVNSYETDAMRQMLEEDGFEIVPFEERADVYVINTCSVTQMADAKSRQMVHRARKMNPDAVVVATGCYVQTEAMTSDKDSTGADIVLGNNQKTRLVESIHSYLKNPHKMWLVRENDPQTYYEPLSIKATGEHTRAFVKVEDGCNQFCSYCIIPYARGRVRSRREEDVVEEIRTLAATGFKEVVLTGIHLSSYGLQSYNREMASGEAEEEIADHGLLHLIESVARVDGVERIRLGSLEPRLMTEEFVRDLSQVDKICPHFHLSLQSGCDQTLARMNRKYTSDDFRNGVALLRKYFDHPAITTDVIVGFPGEMEEEFKTSRAFLEEIQFYEMHVFKYSRRSGTKAAVMPNQVDEQIKHARSKELIALGMEMSQAYRNAERGRQRETLMETRSVIDGKSYWTGFTREYVRVAVRDTGENLNNQIIRGEIGDALTGDVRLLWT